MLQGEGIIPHLFVAGFGSGEWRRRSSRSVGQMLSFGLGRRRLDLVAQSDGPKVMTNRLDTLHGADLLISARERQRLDLGKQRVDVLLGALQPTRGLCV
jgi:hypothetical protein